MKEKRPRSQRIKDQKPAYAPVDGMPFRPLDLTTDVHPVSEAAAQLSRLVGEVTEDPHRQKLITRDGKPAAILLSGKAYQELLRPIREMSAEERRKRGIS